MVNETKYSMSCFSYFFWGCIGGIFAEFLKWYRIRETLTDNMPKYIKSKFYWILTIIGIIVGGICVVIYTKTGVNMNIVLAIHVGGTSILILEKIFATVPQIEKGGVD